MKNKIGLKFLKIFQKLQKIKTKIDEEELVDDLKETFKNTIENTSKLINNLLLTVESTVSDEEIKTETKEIVGNINHELKNLMKESKSKLSGLLKNDNYFEESKSIYFKKYKCL